MPAIRPLDKAHPPRPSRAANAPAPAHPSLATAAQKALSARIELALAAHRSQQTTLSAVRNRTEMIIGITIRDWHRAETGFVLRTRLRARLRADPQAAR